MRKIDVDVLIVGGGGSGLAAANFLTDLGVDFLVVERHTDTSHSPKAHYMNQRTMEIFRHHKLDDKIYPKATPPYNMNKTRWCTSLGGDGPLDGVCFMAIDSMGGGGYRSTYDLKGVTHPTNIPQRRLEPILSDIVSRRNPGRILFGHELISFEQDAEWVSAVVVDLVAKEQIAVRAKYLIGADAGKTVGPFLGIDMVGTGSLSNQVSVYFAADLSQYIKDDDAVIRVIIHPGQKGGGGAKHTGGLSAQGPTHWDGRSEEWRVSWGYSPDDPNAPTEANAEAALRRFLKIDVPVKVLGVSYWTIAAVVANSFQVGRVFLIGDACHKHSPFGGLGLNSGIQDAHNLSWKLALVLKNKAPAALLDTYETERRPVVENNARWSIFAFDNHNILMSSMGLVAGADPAANEAQFAKLLADTPDGHSRRKRMEEVFKLTRLEYGIHDLEMGFTYGKGAVIDDGTPWPPRDPLGHDYTPSSRPGCRLPHAWVRHGERSVSTHDFLPIGGFLLLTRDGGLNWCAAAQRLAANTGVAIRAIQIGETTEVTDPSGAWAEACDIGSDGAILVRPDAYVAYRSKGGVENPYAALGSVLDRILTVAQGG